VKYRGPGIDKRAPSALAKQSCGSRLANSSRITR
jgi:hypothetical protein